jgi:hypothetical protein
MRSSIVGVAVLAASSLGLLAPQAKADEWDKKTILTFSAPVEVPGRVLPAGTYVFKLLDSPSDRHIVQIYNKDENQLIATVLAVPDERLEARGKTVITFDERTSGSPEAVRAWFYPGNTIGQEFVYPHSRAQEIAKRSGQHVLSMRGEDVSEDALKKGEYGAVQPTGEDVDIEKVHKNK